ncbi:hypothetical protein K493DRAFT_308698 [Basidiobolus meristosporus CBS 931.73]|uniref:Uncharacterized protein n=1 Tax=Basidiobolus meristosporus CBS 931.73 TaxID=1314790 RepID=A0A1Y1WYC8_9FUNG|nr:hypothetical protein K493DRAFT_308698 [Basidiobolus meristosporus CBS 931.73]|eukprot:ORX78503.1 hypothetical protein K493DRAFT_308698 [Basidiobolus meristosporus CBS 931.73]
MESIKLGRYDLFILNNIKWAIKLSFKDGLYFGSSTINNITQLKDYVKTFLLINKLGNKYVDDFVQNLETNSDQQLKDKLNTLEYDLNLAKQELKRVLQEYKKVLERRVEVKINQQKSEQRLKNIRQELVGVDWNFNTNLEQKLDVKIRRQFVNLTCKLDRLKEILEKKSKDFTIRYIKHLSNDELEEFNNIFLDDEASDKI